MNLTWCRGGRAVRKSLCRRTCLPLEANRPTGRVRAAAGAQRPARKLERKQVMTLRATYRDAGPVTVVDMSGRITLGDGSALLRKTLLDLLGQKRTRILLNLADVDYIDSSGIGELVSGYTSVNSHGGELKLLHLTKKIHDLLQITRLFTVFEVHSDEHTALRSF